MAFKDRFQLTDSQVRIVGSSEQAHDIWYIQATALVLKAASSLCIYVSQLHGRWWWMKSLMEHNL